MTTFKKLKIAILTILASQNLYAINVNPVMIQSGAGELLYAEINFNQADKNLPIEVSLANTEDLMSIGATHQPPSNLNFYTRFNTDGSGVITITSSRPLIETDLNFIVKIKQGSNTRLQHIKKTLGANHQNSTIYRSSEEKSLAPIMIVNEQDIALNLPVSSNMSSSLEQTPTKALPLSNNPTGNKPLVIQQTLPPKLQTEIKQNLTKTSIPSKIEAHQNNEQMVVPKTANTVKVNSSQDKKVVSEKSIKSNQTTHVVQRNESLWLIASRIAKQNNQNVSDVMKQIKNNNKEAFIQGDINRLKNGATLNVNVSSTAEQTTVAEKPKATSKQSGSAKYRFNQAELSIVTDEQNKQDNITRDSSAASKTSSELSKKIMTSREKTVKLQSNVTRLEANLSKKDQRIQLLNARLAQLQQQLKEQQVKNKPGS